MTMLRAPTRPSSVGNVTALGSDGKVYAFGNTGVAVLEPDEYGDYANGAWRNLSDYPAASSPGSITQTFMMNDGMIWLMFPEYRQLTQTLGIRIFDPQTERLSEIVTSSTNMFQGANPHCSYAMLDDGSVIVGRYRIRDRDHLGEVQDDYAAQTAAAWRPEHPIFMTMDSTDRFYWGQWSEAPMILQPDGRLRLIPTRSTGNNRAAQCTRQIEMRPNYSTALIAGGSWNNPAGAQDHYYNHQDDLRDSWVAGWWRAKNTLPIEKGWSSDGAEIYFEVGAGAYMPKIGKNVLIGGNGGIFTFGMTSAVTVTRAGEVGMFPTYADYEYDGDGARLTGPLYAGLADTSHVGLTAAQIASGGTLRVDSSTSDRSASTNIALLNQPSYIKSIFVRIANNTRWARFSYAGVSADGDDYVFTGVTLPRLCGDDLTPITSSDEFCFGRPSLEPRDASGVILPNGDLLFAAGAEGYGLGNESWSYEELVMKWDGSAAVCEEVGDQTTLVFSKGWCLLPDGHVWIQNGADYFDGTTTFNDWLYMPTEGERTPMSGATPTITSFPAYLDTGTRVTLEGTTLNGIHEGGFYGDEHNLRSNFPIVRLTHQITNKVVYCRTFNFSYRGIQPGRASTCTVEIPQNVPAGDYWVEAVANGVPSAAVATSIRRRAIGDVITSEYIP
jgi:hypothetical protein